MKRFVGFTKGVNLGGWLSQFDSYEKSHFLSFIGESDFEKIAKMGFDHVRVPVDYVLLEDEEGVRNPLGYEILHIALSWCRKYGLRMILDLHEVYGYSFDPLKHGDKKKFFFDRALQSRFYNLWEKIAHEFQNDGDILAFELLNEVVPIEVSQEWREIANKAIKVIRKSCPSHYIVYGGVCYNAATSVPLLGKPYDDRVVYNFHCYEPLPFTHQKAYWVEKMDMERSVNYPEKIGKYVEIAKSLDKNLALLEGKDPNKIIGKEFFEEFFAPAIKSAEDYDVPLYCGEYGVIDQAPVPDTLRWLKDINDVFHKYGIGHALWNYKGKDFGLVDGPRASYCELIAKFC